MSKKDASPLRPATTNTKQDEGLNECKRQFRVDTAVQVLSLLSTASRTLVGENVAGLSPKEEATYAAALNRLELYFDDAEQP